MPQPDALLPRLATWRAALRRDRLTRAAAGLLLAAAVGRLALAGLDRLAFPFPETAVGWGLPLLLALGVPAALLGLWRRGRRPPALPDLAAALDRHLDSDGVILCATHLESAARAPRPMEERVLHRARLLAGRVDFAAWQDLPRRRRRTAGLALAAGLLLAAGGIDLERKALHAWFGPPGLTVSPGSAELPRGATPRLEAVIHRWGGTPRLEITGAPAPVWDESAKVWSWSLPPLREPLRYRVRTAVLASPWHELTPYDPPALAWHRWEIVPPAYTGLETTTWENPAGPLEIPQDSEVRLRVGLDRPVRACTLSAGPDAPGAPRADGSWSFTWSLRESLQPRLLLQDPAGRPGESPLPELRLVPDLPPAAEIIRPRTDERLPLAGLLEVDGAVQDDYGLGQVWLEITPADGRTRSLELPAPAREGLLTAPLELADFQPRFGDLLVLRMGARDNRAPHAQTGFSDFVYLEFGLPGEGESSDHNLAGMERKEVNFRGWIAQLKAILRQLHQPDTRPADVEAPWREVETAMTRTFAEIHAGLRTLEGVDTRELYLEALAALAQGHEWWSSDQPDPLVPPAFTALRHLVRIDLLLRRQQSSCSSAGSSSEDQPPPPPPSQDEAERQRRELENLAAAQRALSREIAESARLGRRGDSNRDLAERQQGLRERTEALGLDGPAAAAPPAMNEAARALREDRPETAHEPSERAARALEEALAEYRRRQLEATARQLSEARRQLEEMADRQEQLSRSCQSPGAAAGQEGLNGALSQWLSGLEEPARRLDRSAPGLADRLRQQRQNLQRDGLEAHGEPALNALLYGFTEEAQKQQEALREALRSASGQLQEITRELAATGYLTVPQVLAEVGRQRGQGGPQGGLAERLEALARQLGDEALAGLAARLALAPPDLADPLLEEVYQRLEQWAGRQAREEILRRHAPPARPPARYRQQLEDYYRRLAEGF